jgi:tRNA pseudouridine38-40 synthase
MRWAAGVEYCGTRYAGWQAQGHAQGIQSVLEAALARVADHPVAVVAAGRTDAGVHAYQQVVHFDAAHARAPHAWVLGTNTYLPDDIALRWVHEVAPRFHARHDAVARSYRYVIHVGRARSALAAGRAAWSIHALDASAMQRAAQALVGAHDFSAFRSAECQSPTPLRRLDAIGVRAHGAFVVLDVRANAFLHHMVRNIAGTLMLVGRRKQPEDWVARVLAGRDRSAAGMTADAAGLYFVGPEYPAPCALPAPPVPSFP